jgi:tellurite resistance protein
MEKNNSEKLLYLKTLYVLAWVDKELHNKEFDFLKEVQKELEIQDSDEIKNWATQPLTLKDLDQKDFENWDIEGKKYLLLLAYLVSEADGIVKDEEKDFITYIKNVLNLNEYTKEMLLDEIKISLTDI